MENKAQRGIQVLRNVCGILKTTQDVTAPTGSVTRQYTELEAVVERMTEHARVQESETHAFRSASTKAKLVYHLLRRQWISPISHAAKLIVPSDAELSSLLTASKGLSYEKLLVVASSLADRVEPHKARFVEAGFNASFVEDLRAEVARLQAALAVKAEHYRRRSAATTALKEQYKRGKSLVRYIDRVIAPVLEQTPEKLSEWKTASRFPRRTPVGQGTVEVTPKVPVVGSTATAATSGNPQPDGHAA